MEDLCRTCGAIPINSDVKNLFNDNELVAFVQNICGIQIKNEEKLPVYICNVCDNMISEMISFQKRCIFVQNFLQCKIWQEHISKQESESTTNPDPLAFEENLHLEKYKQHEDLIENVKDYSPTLVVYYEEQDSDEEEFIDGTNDENSCLDELGTFNYDDIETDTEYNSFQDEEIKEIPVKKKTKSHVRNRWERKWICEICGKISTNSSNLKRHKYIHNAVKAFKCNSCDKAFHFSYELRKHELTHTENHPFVCSFCSAKFTHPSAKIRHEKNHTNTRLHKCSYCEKSFVGKTSLSNHETTHTRIRKYPCEICGHWAFTQKQLKLHKKSKTHKRNEYEHNLRHQKNE